MHNSAHRNILFQIFVLVGTSALATCFYLPATSAILLNLHVKPQFIHSILSNVRSRFDEIIKRKLDSGTYSVMQEASEHVNTESFSRSE